MICRSRILSAIASILLGLGTLEAQVHHVERPDPMEVYFLADVDRLGDRVRVLYQTFPSLEQQSRDDWTVNVYVVELHADGAVKQQRLASGQRRYGALLLRRGHDEVFLIPAPGAPGSGLTQPLEVRSTRDGSLRSSTEVDVMPRVEMGVGNIGPTDDGNLFVLDVDSHDSRGRATGIAWHKLSPSGEIVGQGTYENGGALVRFAGVFPARDGGIGITVISSVATNATQLKTDIDNPLQRTVDGHTVEAEVFSETRMLTTDAKGRTRLLSEALERTFMWDASPESSKDAAPEKRLRMAFEKMQIQEEIGLKLGVRTLQHTPDAGNDTDRIRPTPSGYATLAKKTVRRDRVPPASGPYYLEIGLDGVIQRELYLGPLAEQIGARDFADFLPTSDGGFLLVGYRTPEGTRREQLHVTRVDAQGKPKSIVPLGVRGWRLEGIAGAASDVWLIGHQWSDEHRRTLLVLHNVDMSVAQPLMPAQRAVAATPVPAAAKPEQIPAGLFTEPPPSEPTADCSCSCEEFTELRTMLEGIQKMSDADKMQLVSDPGYLKRLGCMATCGVAYSQCGTP